MQYSSLPVQICDAEIKGAYHLQKPSGWKFQA